MITKTLSAWPIIPYFSQIAVVVFVFQFLFFKSWVVVSKMIHFDCGLAHIFQMAWRFNQHLVIYPMY